MKEIIQAAVFRCIFIFCFCINLSADWKDDYAVAKGFKLEIDSLGFRFPTAIAFVPNPGSSPDSPLYYVTEIRGRILVVSNDRTVRTFAEDFFKLTPVLELPEVAGEIGMAGLCLDPRTGYVFVSYAYEDDAGLYRNGISRFETVPGEFGLEPSSHIQLAPILKNILSAVSHQIGPMAIHDDYLYVAIGDAEVALESSDINSVRGKILRMTLDGFPAPGNPHAVDDDPNKARNYVWASGLRNPFSLKIVNGDVYVADNGPGVDRFVRVQAGNDFLYDGSNESIAINPLYLWSPAVSPVQMDYNRDLAETAGFPEFWADSFIIALSGVPSAPPGESDRGAKSVTSLGVDLNTGKVSRPPRLLLKYVGYDQQLPVGAAFGPDGLYVVPLFEDSDGNSGILKVTYAPDDEHPRILDELNPLVLFEKYACTACHKIDGAGYGQVGPEIFRNELGSRLLAKLNSDDYRAQLEAVDQLKVEPFVNYADVRKTISDLEGEEMVRTWLKHRLMEPRFDQQVIAMPNLGMSEEEAIALTDYLLAGQNWLPFASATNSMKNFLKGILPEANSKSLLLMLGIGGIGGGIAGCLLVGLLWRFKVRRNRLPPP